MSSEEEEEEELHSNHAEYNSEESGELPLNRENILGCIYIMTPKVIRFLFLTLLTMGFLLAIVLAAQYGIVIPLSYQKNHLEYNMTTGCPLDGSRCYGNGIACPTEPAFHWGCFGLGVATLAVGVGVILIISFILNVIWISYVRVYHPKRFKPQ